MLVFKQKLWVVFNSKTKKLLKKTFMVKRLSITLDGLIFKFINFRKIPKL